MKIDYADKFVDERLKDRVDSFFRRKVSVAFRGKKVKVFRCAAFVGAAAILGVSGLNAFSGIKSTADAPDQPLTVNFTSINVSYAPNKGLIDRDVLGSDSKGATDSESASQGGLSEVLSEHESSFKESDPYPEFSKKIGRWTPEQARLFVIAYRVGEEIGWPETMQSILYQETLAGKLGRVNIFGDAFGVAQVKPGTARFVWMHFKDIERVEDETELVNRLKNDDEYNLRVGSRYFLYCLNKYKGDWKHALVAYNIGHNGAKKVSKEDTFTFNYVVKLKEKLELVREFNKMIDIDQYSVEQDGSDPSKGGQSAQNEPAKLPGKNGKAIASPEMG